MGRTGGDMGQLATSLLLASLVATSPTTIFSVTNGANFVTPITTNAMPFDVYFRKSGGWTLLSICWKSNVPNYLVEASKTLTPWTNCAMFFTTNSGWPVTNHLQGFNDNDPAVPFGPPPQMFYRITPLP